MEERIYAKLDWAVSIALRAKQNKNIDPGKRRRVRERCNSLVQLAQKADPQNPKSLRTFCRSFDGFQQLCGTLMPRSYIQTCARERI
jgi:hypothetical protein